MGSIIYHFQFILVRNPLYLIYITYIAIYMNRHYRTCPVSYKIFYLGGIHRIRNRVYITKNRLKAISDYRMGCRCKCKRSRYHLPLQIHGLKCHLKCHVSVYKEFNVVNVQILFQCILQLNMFLSHICNPMCIPQ